MSKIKKKSSSKIKSMETKKNKNIEKGSSISALLLKSPRPVLNTFVKKQRIPKYPLKDLPKNSI